MGAQSRIITMVLWWGAAALVGLWAGLAFFAFLWAQNAVLWGAMMFGPLVLVVGAVWMRGAVHRKRGARGCCTKCDYDRTGIGAGRACPECGTIPDPSRLNT